MNVAETVKALDGMLRVGQAAEFMGVSTETLRNWDKSGKLVAARHPINGYWFYRQEDLDKFLGELLEERKAVNLR